MRAHQLVAPALLREPLHHLQAKQSSLVVVFFVVVPWSDRLMGVGAGGGWGRNHLPLSLFNSISDEWAPPCKTRFWIMRPQP